MVSLIITPDKFLWTESAASSVLCGTDVKSEVYSQSKSNEIQQNTPHSERSDCSSGNTWQVTESIIFTNIISMNLIYELAIIFNKYSFPILMHNHRYIFVYKEWVNTWWGQVIQPCFRATFFLLLAMFEGMMSTIIKTGLLSDDMT